MMDVIGVGGLLGKSKNASSLENCCTLENNASNSARESSGWRPNTAR